MLWEHHKLVYMVFDYFAALASVNSEDIFHIHQNAFTLFVEQCQLAVPGSAACKAENLDMLFVLVNAASRDDHAADRHNAHRARIA